ncbi:MAG TPA: hypothetical protein VEW42_06115 [Candidatus Eisenbacteria bacterium]|nr:hypothetical protein [Candidatus Eisenbacteria bacterium]
MKLNELNPQEWERLFSTYSGLAVSSARSRGVLDEDAALTDTILNVVTTARDKDELWTKAAQRVTRQARQQAINQRRSPSYGGGKRMAETDSLDTMPPSRQHALRITDSLEQGVTTEETAREAWRRLTPREKK